MKSSRIPYVVTAAFLALLVVGAWIGRGSFEPLAVGSRAPDFTYPNLEGEMVSLEGHRGEVVLVNIWATWCHPCRLEMPSMQRLYEEMGDEGFEILAVSIDQNPGGQDSFGRPNAGLRAFADSLGLTFPILHNRQGDIQDRYQTTGVPESFVVGRDGTIYKKVAGATEWDTDDKKELIRRLLDES